MNMNHHQHSSIFKQKGFTLLELMISLVLGLLISAAALQLFLTSQKNLALQQGFANIQNDSLFGLESVVRDIRLANLNAAQPKVDDTVLHGGIVLSGKNFTTLENTTTHLPTITLENAISESAVGSSNLVGVKSDVLVIQYKNTVDNQFNCEGEGITKDAYVVQKYFLRDDVSRNDPNSPLSLACKATSYAGDEPAKIDLSGKGSIIIPRVDHFNVLLAVARDGMNAGCSAAATADGQLDCFGYITIKDYQKLTVKPQIVAIKVGLFVRSTDSIGKNKFFDKNKVFSVLNTSAKLTEHAKNDLYLRNVVTQTIAIRNGFGIEK